MVRLEERCDLEECVLRDLKYFYRQKVTRQDLQKLSREGLQQVSLQHTSIYINIIVIYNYYTPQI